LSSQTRFGHTVDIVVVVENITSMALSPQVHYPNRQPNENDDTTNSSPDNWTQFRAGFRSWRWRTGTIVGVGW
jgi:hypothetical protein